MRIRTAHRRWLLVALFMAALFQLAIVVRSPVISRDGVTFISLAKALVQMPASAVFAADHEPGYPAMILSGWCIVTAIGGDQGVFSWILGARLAAGLCGVLSVLVIWLLTKRLFDERVAAVSTLIFAALPLFRQNASDALSDTPHLLFYLLAAWMAAEGFVRSTPFWFLGAGLASALAYWVRAEGLSVALVTGILLVVWSWRHRGTQPKIIFLCVLALLVGAAASAPYMLTTGKLMAKETLTRLVNRAAWTEKFPAQVDRPGLSLDRSAIEAGGAAYTGERPRSGPFRRLVEALSRLFTKTSHGLRYMLLVPLMFGLFAPWARKAQKAPALLLRTLIGFHLLVLLGLYEMWEWISIRHTMPLIGLTIPWIGSGTICFAERLNSALPGVQTGSVENRHNSRVLGFLVFVIVVGLAPRALRPLHYHRIAVVEAAKWVGAQVKPGDWVLSNSTYVPFYANVPGRVLRAFDTIPEVKAFPGVLPYDFVVLDLGSSDFNQKWILELAPFYQQVKVDRKWASSEILLLRAKSAAQATSSDALSQFVKHQN